MDENETEIPPYLRKEAKAPIDHARWYLDATDVRMAWLPPEQIGAISLMRSDANTEELIRRQMPTLRLNVGGKLFDPRADYKFWQANAKVPLLDTSDDFDDFPF